MLNDTNQAEQFYHEALAIDPKQLAPYLELLKLLPEKPLIEDIPWLRQGVSLFDRHPIFQFALGEMYLRRGMFKEAEKALQTSAKIQPANSLLQFRLFELFNQTNRQEEGLKFLKGALESADSLPEKFRDPRQYFSKALAAAKKQDVSGAFLFLRNSLLYESALLGENDEGTLQWLEKQYSSQETSEEKGLFQVFLLYVNGENRQAKEKIEKIQSRLTSPSLKRDSKRLLDLCSGKLAAEKAYANHEALKKQAAAEALAKATLKKNSSISLATPSGQISGVIASGKPQVNTNAQQIQQLLDFAKANADDADIQLETGRKLENLGDSANAKACFLNGTKANPQHVSCLQGLARWHFRAGELNEAQAVLAKALQVDSNHVSSLALSGRVFYAKRDFIDALKASLRAIELDADCAEARLVTARVYQESKRYQDALAEIDKGLLALRDSTSPISQELEAIRTAIRESGN
jgi:tetratricopeptide (TPR) repeat protein